MATPPGSSSSWARGSTRGPGGCPELAGATVFEVDHPASQQDKLRRIGGLAPMAGRVVPVAIDLASRTPWSRPRERPASIGRP